MFYINCKDFSETSTLASAECKEKAENLLNLFKREYPYIIGEYWISKRPCKDNLTKQETFILKNNDLDGYCLAWPYQDLRKFL